MFASFQEPDDSPGVQQSTELFEATSPRFITAAIVVGSLLVLASVAGIVYEIRRDKSQKGLYKTKCFTLSWGKYKKARLLKELKGMYMYLLLEPIFRKALPLAITVLQIMAFGNLGVIWWTKFILVKNYGAHSFLPRWKSSWRNARGRSLEIGFKPWKNIVTLIIVPPAKTATGEYSQSTSFLIHKLIH